MNTFIRKQFLLRTFGLRRAIQSLLLCVLACNLAQAQGLTAVSDTLRTGPLQTVRKSIIHNDIIPGESYSWKLTVSPTLAQGTAVIDGEYLVFIPAMGYHGTVNLEYELSGSAATDTATITVIVSEYNNPVNIIDPDVECYDYMDTDITFGIRHKYSSSPGPGSGDYIDAMTSPLVGDLNGDGKPEIVMMGNYTTYGTGASTVYRYINIYNGQTGERLYQYDFTVGSSTTDPYGNMSIGSPYHRPPAILALADLDNDGIGEIVMCHTESGRVAAFKPAFSGATITGMTKMWEGHNLAGTAVSYKAPITNTSQDVYGYPNPYIADLDADGIPEVIVYNKIYNGATGALLMSWQDAGPKGSSITSGLSETNSGSPLTFAHATDVRNVAMTGRRPVNGTYADRYLAVPAIVDIDGDGKQEIITGNRIHKFDIDNKTDHTLNTYTTIEGPQSVEVLEGSSSVIYHLSDGFTRVADIDGDGQLDIIVVCPGNDGSLDVKIIVYVWSLDDRNNVKACVSFYCDGANGNFSIPFIGDINGKLDGWDGEAYTKKLPEICILGGAMYIDNSSRTGVKFHPETDEELRRGVGLDNNNTSASNRRFNRPHGSISEYAGHIIGLTWDASATVPQEKLKVSWAMEHQDRSDNTGITLFDFDNNNAADLCYRDETTLRVISPARGKKDYVELGETVSATSSVMFSTPVYCGTAFEYPTIADVNMDGSADIVVTHIDKDSRDLDMSHGYFNVYEYQGAKWAPCPPVWNQGMYDPTQVREDLKINARPISMLTQFVKNGETITPYNGSWIQQPIVRDGDDYVPVVRKPDAILLDMKVKVTSSASATVTLTIRNSGSASINEQTPVAFYNGGILGKDLEEASLINNAQLVGVDIFPDETRVLTYAIFGDFNDCLIWARIMDDGTDFPAAGYDDCDRSNNTFSGIDCPYLVYTVTALPDTVLCGTTDNVLLTAEPDVTPHYTPTYQWYHNDVEIQGATLQTYTATLAGEYKCYVIEDVCRGFSSVKTITRETPVAEDDNDIIVHGIPKSINVLQNDTKSQYCDAIPHIATEDEPKHGTAVVQPDGTIFYSPNPGTAETADSIKYTIGNGSNKATVRILLYPIPKITVIQPVKMDTTICAGQGFVFQESYIDTDEHGETFGDNLFHWGEYSPTIDPANWITVETGTSNNGKVEVSYIFPEGTIPAGYYRAVVSNDTYKNTAYRAISDTAHITISPALTGGKIDSVQTIIYGQTPAGLKSTTDASGGVGTFTYQWEQSTDGTTWIPVTGAESSTYQPVGALTAPIQYCRKASNDCGTVYSDTVTIVPVKPLSLKYVACEDALITMGFDNPTTSGVTFFWYDEETEGNLIRVTASDTIIRIKDDNGTQTFWAEPIYNSVSLPRYKVELELSVNCGTTTPTGCAATGTVLFKEDFGGNESSDPQRASNPGWTGSKTTYQYVTHTDYWLPNPGHYALLKSIAGKSHDWAHSFLDDHTSWGDQSSGYFLAFDATQESGEFYNFEMEGLCAGNNLNFSAWLMNINPIKSSTTTWSHPNVQFVIEDMAGNVLSRFYTGNVERTSGPTWVNYACQFSVPTGIDKVKVRFINNVTSGNTSGNDVAIDDIAVRFCAPPVTITQPANRDTMLCLGSSFTFAVNYTDDGTFTNGAQKLYYHWEHNPAGDINNPAAWQLIDETQDSSSNGTINSVYNLNPVTLADSGYYRMAVANAENINNYNCRAMSDIIHLRVADYATAADVTANDTTICYNTTVTLTASASGEASPVFKWYVSQTEATPFHIGASYITPALTADTTFYISVTGDKYCENEIYERKAVKVTVYPELNGGSIGISETYCYGAIMPAILVGINSSVGGSGDYAYSWQSSTDSNMWSNLGSSEQTYSLGGSEASQTTFYRREVTDNSGCGTKYSDVITITVLPTPAVSIGTRDLCVGIKTQLSNSTDGTWTNNNDMVAEIISNSEVKALHPGTATLTYTNPATGCFAIIPITVDSFPEVAEITGEKVLCPNNTIQLTNDTLGGEWSKNNDNVTFDSPTTTNPVTIKGITEGTTFVTYTVSNGVCQTKRTYLLKIISNTPPTIIIGIER